MPEPVKVPEQVIAQQHNDYIKGLITKYTAKARHLWKNICLYNPYNFAYDNNYYEEMRKTLIWGGTDDKGALIPGNKDEIKVQTQQLYTDVHKTGEEDGGAGGTRRIIDLHRNDCLFALFDAIKKAVRVITTEKSTEFWLGDDTALKIYDDPESYKTWMQTLMRLNSGELHGRVIGPQVSEFSSEDLSKNYVENLFRSDCSGFDVMSTPENLVLFLNPEDYDDLDTGVARRGQMDTRAINLDMLRKYCPTIYPLRGMRPGFARLIDRRALRIRNYFQTTDTATPMEYQNWRHKLFFFWTCNMFSLFAGTLFVPSPHFVASPRFYDKYKLIGQKIELEQAERGAKSKDAS